VLIKGEQGTFPTLPFDEQRLILSNRLREHPEKPFQPIWRLDSRIKTENQTVRERSLLFFCCLNGFFCIEEKRSKAHKSEKIFLEENNGRQKEYFSGRRRHERTDRGD
jgi:hypothetical protein